MKLTILDYFLYKISKKVVTVNKKLHNKIGCDSPGSEEYAKKYALNQFNICVENGIKVPVLGKDVLEIGCGHGGITCYLSAAGAKSVCGIDINEENLKYSDAIMQEVFKESVENVKKRTKFEIIDASNTQKKGESFDIVFALNSFEHFDDPSAVMKESYRLLKKDGKMIVHPFSSIYSRYGAHIKYGVTIPWVNLFFTDKVIIRALLRAAKDDDNIYQIYPGLLNNPKTIRDIRKYKDLNDITFVKFKKMALNCGFVIEYFHPITGGGIFGYIGKVINKIPLLKNTIFMDIFSYSASAILVKR
jgi:2-polyprenyl-3-methyl-5-hydroxy-6-metoxy-1,4-benzoquinol methylase